MSAHYGDIFSNRHLDPNGSVLSPDAAKYFKCSKTHNHWIRSMGEDSWHLVISVNCDLCIIIT